MAALSGEQIAQLAYQAGFRGEQLVQMVAIAKRESGWDPAAHRTDQPKSKMVGDRGLWQINYTWDDKLIKAGIIKQRSDLLDPVKNAQAAWYVSGQGKSIAPWSAVQGKGWAQGGNPLAGVNLGAGRAAVQSATSSGLLTQPYVSPAGAGGTPSGAGGAAPSGGTGPAAPGYNYTYAGTPAAQRGPQMNAQEERDLFNKYLKTKTAAEQTKLIEDLKQPRDLAGVGAYMATAPDEVNRYIKFLGTLDAGNQYSERNLLAAPDPAGSTEMTNLLNRFGVSYSNAPNPTPALLAFLNGIGLNMDTAEGVKRRAIERIGASTSDAMADIDRTAGRAKQNVTADLVRRGVLSSGESNTRYAKQAEDVATQRSDVQRTATNATDSVESAYTTAQSLARQQALDRILGAEQQQASDRAASAAQVDATRAQQQASDDAFAREKAAQDASLKAQEDALRQSSAGASV